MQLKRVVRAEAGGSRPSRLQKCPALLVWRARVCGTGMGFYILWPHTAAFSKQSTIIQSDKRANTEHSRVKKKHVPPLFVNSCLPASLCFFVFSHIVALSLVPPCYFTASILLLSRQQHLRIEVHLAYAPVTMCVFSSCSRGRFSSLSLFPQSGSF